MFGLFLTIVFAIDVALQTPAGGPNTLVVVDSAMSAFILTFVFSVVLLIGFAFGRRHSRP